MEVKLTDYPAIAAITKVFSVTVTCTVSSLTFSTSQLVSKTIEVGIDNQPFTMNYAVTKSPNCAQNPTWSLSPSLTFVTKAEDTDKKKTGSKMILDRLRNSFSGSDHDVQRRSSLTLETTSSISSDRSASNQQDRINKLNYNHHPSRRKNFTRYLRKKLTSKKKVQRQNTV